MENKLKFFNYIYTPITDNKVLTIYNKHNIIYERTIIYHDFTVSLIDLVFSTYLGDDITTTKQQKQHFIWCWNKTIESFLAEGLNFDDKKLKSYFWDIISEMFYSVRNKTLDTGQRFINICSYLLSYYSSKSLLDMDSFITLYKLFDDALIIND